MDLYYIFRAFSKHLGAIAIFCTFVDQEEPFW